MEDKLQFKVIEFNKGAKRIILSHSRVFEDEKKSEEVEVKKTQAKAAAATKKSVKKIKDNIEKTTLGDITELAALKDQMEADAKTKKSKE